MKIAVKTYFSFGQALLLNPNIPKKRLREGNKHWNSTIPMQTFLKQFWFEVQISGTRNIVQEFLEFELLSYVPVCRLGPVIYMELDVQGVPIWELLNRISETIRDRGF